MTGDLRGRPDLGVVLPRELPPAQVAALAVAAEQAGVDEVWVVEDLPYTGGVAMAALALGATSRVRVGIGILPAVARNVAFAAMDLATLASAWPGRLHVGLGHGVADWMRQVGVLPASPLGALREATQALRALLAGERVQVAGDAVRLDGVTLVHPPEPVPPVSLGVRGPRSVALAAEVADGLVLAEPTPAAYVAAARARLDAGHADDAGQGSARAPGGSAAVPPARLTAYGLTALGEPREALAAAVAPLVRAGLGDGSLLPHVADLPYRGELDAWLAAGGPVPDTWLDDLVLVGGPAEIAAGVLRRGAAGADAVVLSLRSPHPPVPPGVLDRAGVAWLHRQLAAVAEVVSALPPARPRSGASG